MDEDVLALLPRRSGHFRLESGHHGELWLELPRLYLRPAPVIALATELARRLGPHRPEIVCGPLVEGAFVALTVAQVLDVPFTYSEPRASDAPGLYAVAYRVPASLRPELRGHRVAIVNDVINAGSAVAGTFADLRAAEANPVAVATLAVLGDWAATFTAQHGLALETLVTSPNRVWEPAQCPLCAQGEPLTDERGKS
jgi:orotate phosphoribosyltransferase